MTNTQTEHTSANKTLDRTINITVRDLDNQLEILLYYVCIMTCSFMTVY